MRGAALLTALALAAASAAEAQVLLSVRQDGTKVIYNIPSASSHPIGDLNWLARQHDRRSPYDPIIDRYASRYNVDPVLVRAVIQVESDFNPQCVSHKGAQGLMQLMPDTARQYGVSQIFDPEENIHAGVRHLAGLLAIFPNNLPHVLAAYNAGENAVTRHGGIPPYEETTNYVKRALTVYYGSPYGQAVSFAGGRTPTLRGGFKAKTVTPVFASSIPLAAASARVIPQIRYLAVR
ncbi:MAG TPA: lytic transglycosylase domain-containing protein [Thermoanaerobaculia bacterium]|nr:lytic transglycosylase domain-containing protein [Thermoanaerobaculia bacterium]